MSVVGRKLIQAGSCPECRERPRYVLTKGIYLAEWGMRMVCGCWGQMADGQSRSRQIARWNKGCKGRPHAYVGGDTS